MMEDGDTATVGGPFRNETQLRIEEAIRACPLLTIFGVGVYGKPSQDEYEQEFATTRQGLLEDTASFERVCAFLERVAPMAFS